MRLYEMYIKSGIWKIRKYWVKLTKEYQRCIYSGNDGLHLCDHPEYSPAPCDGCEFCITPEDLD